MLLAEKDSDVLYLVPIITQHQVLQHYDASLLSRPTHYCLILSVIFSGKGNKWTEQQLRLDAFFHSCRHNAAQKNVGYVGVVGWHPILIQCFLLRNHLGRKYLCQQYISHL